MILVTCFACFSLDLLFVFIWLKLVKIPVVCSLLFDNSKNQILQTLTAFILCFGIHFDFFFGHSRRFVFLGMTQQLLKSLTKTMSLLCCCCDRKKILIFFWPWQNRAQKTCKKRIDFWHNFKSRQFSTAECWFLQTVQYCTLSKF